MSDAQYTSVMSEIRRVILQRLDQLGRSRYWLGKKAAEKGIVGNRETVFRFLRGDRDTSTTIASGLLRVLDLEVLPRRQRRKK